MPKLAMAMNEGTVVEWLVNNGTFVESAQPLAAIETEKVAYDVESPEAGYFKHVVSEGETVDCDRTQATEDRSQRNIWAFASKLAL